MHTCKITQYFESYGNDYKQLIILKKGNIVFNAIITNYLKNIILFA